MTDIMKVICWAMLAGETRPKSIAAATGLGRDTVATYMCWARKAEFDHDLARSLMNADSLRRKQGLHHASASHSRLRLVQKPTLGQLAEAA